MEKTADLADQRAFWVALVRMVRGHRHWGWVMSAPQADPAVEVIALLGFARAHDPDARHRGA